MIISLVIAFGHTERLRRPATDVFFDNQHFSSAKEIR